MGMGHHIHKKSMMNPKSLRPPLEIQLPDTEQIFHLKKETPGYVSKMAAFVPSSTSPNKGGAGVKANYNSIGGGISVIGKSPNAMIQKTGLVNIKIDDAQGLKSAYKSNPTEG